MKKWKVYLDKKYSFLMGANRKSEVLKKAKKWMKLANLKGKITIH